MLDANIWLKAKLFFTNYRMQCCLYTKYILQLCWTELRLTTQTLDQYRP